MLLDTLPAKGTKEHAHTVKQSLPLKKKIEKKSFKMDKIHKPTSSYFGFISLYPVVMCLHSRSSNNTSLLLVTTGGYIVTCLSSALTLVATLFLVVCYQGKDLQNHTVPFLADF